MTSVLSAVSSNNCRILKVLLAVPQSVPKADLQSGLLQAAKLGYHECVACILATGAIDLDTTDPNDNSVTYLAVQNNQPSVLMKLVELGAEVNMKGGNKYAPIHIAAQYGFEECLKILINNGAMLNIKNKSGNTPLILASIYKQVHMMKMLIDAGCDVNIQNKEGCTALHYCCHRATGVGLLLGAGADPNITDKDNITPMLMAATEGFDNVIKTLVKYNGDVNIASEPFKMTPLHILSLKGHTQCMKDLIYGGANMNLNDAQNRTPLWYAVKNENIDLIKLLLRSNCVVDTFRCSGSVNNDACPTRLAFSSGLINVIKMFILTGFDKAHLKICLGEDEIKEKISQEKDIEHWLEHAHDILSLKQICRQWIRHHLGLHLYHDINQLPIPPAMKDFIFLKEIDEEHT